MGTTLTGTTPQDTYDSLIKVTDNGPLSGTAKYLSDGLGNDSALALSTTAVGIGTSAPSVKLHISAGQFLTCGVAIGGGADVNSGLRIKAPIATTNYNWLIGAQENINNGFEITPSTAVGGTTFSTPALSILASSGNVGIGTSSPDTPLTIQSASANAKGLKLIGRAADNISILGFNNNANSSEYGYVAGIPTEFRINSGSGLPITFTNLDTERVRILAAGGLTFNGDTAQANALDDYEEGTWTMGITFGGASVGVTYSNTTGTYTKIGRQVTVNGVLVLTSKGSSTGAVLITGLPFTISSGNAFYAAATLRLENVTFANQFQAYGGVASTVIAIDEITEAGVNGSLTDADFANNSTVMVSLTYFV